MHQQKKSIFTFSFCFTRIAILAMFITMPVLSWAQTPSPYWTGDGKKGMSLAILVPQGQSLSRDFAYLPAMIQGCLVSNISKYSAISVLDRVALDKVIAETLDPAYKDNLDIVRLGHVAQTGYIMTGNVIKTSSGYTMQINVSDTTPNSQTLASYSGSFTAAQLDDQTAVQKASLDLLTQMGVMLTDRAKQELSTVNARESINAQTALAQGITAQKQGTEIAALSYYFQAAALDPALLEAANRSSVLAANIRSGAIGQNARNDIQWRKDWIARLAETEQLFEDVCKNPSRPHILFYDTQVTEGMINYRTETMDLNTFVVLCGSSTWIDTLDRIIKSVYAGLRATDKIGPADWNLYNWPWTGVTNSNVFYRLNERGQRIDFEITIELVNSGNKIIGRHTFKLGTRFSAERNNYAGPVSISSSGYSTYFVTFENIKISDITDSMTLRITKINGVDTQTAIRNGMLQIRALLFNPKEVGIRETIRQALGPDNDKWDFKAGEVNRNFNREM